LVESLNGRGCVRWQKDGFDVWISMLNCCRMTKSIIQHGNDLKSRIITWNILLNFTYETTVEPVHKYFAVNRSLVVCTPKDWKAILIFAF